MSESFEKVMEEMREKVASPYWTNMADRLQEAHEHDMEQRMREQYHRGYVAGQRSMDAEHYAMALKLRRLRFDGDSHANLSKLAYAIYPCATGWTCESCDGLRDKLIELLGGVHDESVSVGASGGADCADCDCGAGEPRLVTYDELGNERYKAVCELRSISDSYMTTGDAAQFVCDMANAINAEGCDSETIYKGLRDRLIHLLGGNTEPLPNFSELFRTFAEPNLPKSAEIAKPENADGGKITITAELREWYRATPYLGKGSFELCAIADRIDAQFKRLCWHQEAVLQSTIDTMADEAKRLEVQRHGFKSAFDSTRDMLDKRTDERDELRKELRKIADCVGVPHERDLSEYSDEAVIDSIYWRIDNIFKVDIEELQAQVADCCEQRDKARAKAVNLRNSLCDTQRRVKVKCDELQRVLNAIRAVVLDE